MNDKNFIEELRQNGTLILVILSSLQILIYCPPHYTRFIHSIKYPLHKFSNIVIKSQQL